MMNHPLPFVCFVLLSAATLCAEAGSAAKSNPPGRPAADAAVKPRPAAGAAANQAGSLTDAGVGKQPAADAAKERDASPQRKSKETGADQSRKALVQEIMSKLPKGAVAVTTDYSGQTWLVNGVYAKKIDQVKKEISDAMRAQQYQFMHEIPLTADQSRVLVAWNRKDIKLIFMIWKISEKETGFSWGKAQ